MYEICKRLCYIKTQPIGQFLSMYTVSQKKPAPLMQVGINSVIFQIQKIRNIRFVGNFIRNKSCEFYYDDVTMTSFIGNK